MKSKNKYFGANQITGLVLIALSAVLWYFRPASDCQWWQLFCHGASLIITPIFLVICGILLIVGIIKLLRRNK